MSQSLSCVLHSCNPFHATTGLFAYSHLDFEADRDTSPNGDPSLADMTRVALSILAKNPRGFLLFVEGKCPGSVTSLLLSCVYIACSPTSVPDVFFSYNALRLLLNEKMDLKSETTAETVHIL